MLVKCTLQGEDSDGDLRDHLSRCWLFLVKFWKDASLFVPRADAGRRGPRPKCEPCYPRVSPEKINSLQLSNQSYNGFLSYVSFQESRRFGGMAFARKRLKEILRKHPNDVVILSAFRTPITRAYKGGLRNAYPEQMLAAVSVYAHRTHNGLLISYFLGLKSNLERQPFASTSPHP